jgi:hypothetical protein
MKVARLALSNGQALQAMIRYQLMVPQLRVLLRSFLLLLAMSLSGSFLVSAQAGDWQLVDSAEPESLGDGISYVRKSVRATGDTGFFSRKTIDLVFFEAQYFTLKVIDEGTEAAPVHEGIAEAMQANFCLAGCNGGFFHPDFRPLGLMIADGVRTHKLETSKLLSGLVIADADAGGLKLLRRAEFQDRQGIDALLQSGPFLVDQGTVVAGLSSEPSRRRTFLLWDGKAGKAGRWAMGVSSSLTLAELGAALADADVITEFKVHRALNLDGGSSTGMYFDRGAGEKDFELRPAKRVRNYLGIAPR